MKLCTSCAAVMLLLAASAMLADAQLHRGGYSRGGGWRSMMNGGNGRIWQNTGLSQRIWQRKLQGEQAVESVEGAQWGGRHGMHSSAPGTSWQNNGPGRIWQSGRKLMGAQSVQAADAASQWGRGGSWRSSVPVSTGRTWQTGGGRIWQGRKLQGAQAVESADAAQWGGRTWQTGGPSWSGGSSGRLWQNGRKLADAAAVSEQQDGGGAWGPSEWSAWGGNDGNSRLWQNGGDFSRWGSKKL